MSMDKLATMLKGLRAAAKAVVEMECDRVNVDKDTEPYDPIANPGQFDERIVALAWAVEGCVSESSDEPGASLRSLVIARFGGVGAVSPVAYRYELGKLAQECGREVDEDFRKEVTSILRELPCPLD